MTDEHLDPEMDPIPELGDLAPEPGPDYWTAIDARLNAVEAERGPVGTGEIQTEARSDGDTDDAVIRLDDMRNTSTDNRQWWRNRQSILAVAAAALLILVGGAALLVVLNGDDGDGVTVETADDDTADDTADDGVDGEVDDSNGNGDSQEPQDGSDDAADIDTGDTDDPTVLPASATCYAGDGVVQVLDITDDGTIRAAVADEGGSFLYNAFGNAVDDSGVLVMRIENGTGDTFHDLWQLGPNSDSLAMGEGDQGSVRTDCAGVRRAGELYDTLSTLDPIPDPFVPVIDYATTSCWTKPNGSSPSDDFIELVNQDDVEFVRLLGYGLGDDGLVEAHPRGNRTLRLRQRVGARCRNLDSGRGDQPTDRDLRDQ